MRKEITFKDAMELEDGHIVYVDDYDEFGGKNQKTTKRKSGLHPEGINYYDFGLSDYYESKRGAKLFIEEDKKINKVKIGFVEYVVSQETLDKVLELVTPQKMPELDGDQRDELIDLLAEGYKWIAKDNDEGCNVFAYIEEPHLYGNLFDVDNEVAFDTVMDYDIKPSTKYKIANLLKTR
ncbi:MAG: hypothetical protein ACRDD8_06865 [Bacteroidales bacterium]